MGSNAGTGSETTTMTLDEQYMNFLKRNNRRSRECIEQGYNELRDYILSKTDGRFKDTIVVSMSKENLSLNYMWPGYVGNSPSDPNDDVGVIFHSKRYLKYSHIEHFKGIGQHKSLSEPDYKFEKLEILGENYDQWAQQIQNDIENFYMNSSLQFIGCYTEPDNHNIFNFVMYKMCKPAKKKNKFKIIVDTIFGDVTSSSLQTYLTDKYNTNKQILRGILPIYTYDRFSVTHDEPQALMHIIILECGSSKYHDQKDIEFQVVHFPTAEKDKNYELLVQEYINEYGGENQTELLAIVPKVNAADSLLVFTYTI